MNLWYKFKKKFKLHSNIILRTCQDVQLIGRHMNEKRIQYRHPFKFEYNKSFKYKTTSYSPRIIGPYTYVINHHKCCDHIFVPNLPLNAKISIMISNHSYLNMECLDPYHTIYSR